MVEYELDKLEIIDLSGKRRVYANSPDTPLHLDTPENYENGNVRL